MPNPEIITGNFDLNSEQSLVAGILSHGFPAWAEISQIVRPTTFISDNHSLFFKVSDYIFSKYGDITLDWPTFINGAIAVGLQDFFNKKSEREYLKKLKSDFHIELPNIKILATKLRKLEVVRQLRQEIQKAESELSKVNGDERLSEILGKIENPIADFTQYLHGIDNNGPELILKNLGSYLDNLESNPVEQVGISTGFKRWDKAIGGGLIPGSVSMIGARMKVGKALRHGSLVYTRNGPQKIENCKVGDRVLTPNGESKIIAIHPQGKVPIYRIRFNDKTYVDCCDNHIWPVKHYRNKKEFIGPLTTKELRNRKLKHNNYQYSLPLCQPCRFEKKPIPADAYLIGLLIGDGTLGKGPYITTFDEEIKDYIKNVLVEGYVLNKDSEDKHRGGYLITKGRTGKKKNHYTEILRCLKLYGLGSHDKFIPDVYKYNSIETRWEILRGLMDTDGHSNGTTLEYTTTSIKLAKDFQEIVCSLGGMCRIKGRYTKCDGKQFWSYRLNPKFNDNRKCFKLTRKINSTTIRKKPNIRKAICSIKYIGDYEATCITIDSVEGLFLTNNCTVTHNSSLCDVMAYNIMSTGTPCLILDAEMTRNIHYDRLLGRVSKVPMHEIKSGQYALNDIKKEKVRLAQKVLEALPYHYLNISSQEFEETLSEAKRWILNVVKLNSQGHANPCVVILDYLKTMSQSSIENNIREHQRLGLCTAELINFAIKYNISCLAFLQLNREGIKSEETSVFAGSDRIGMSCSNASIFKLQSEEEMGEQRDNSNNSSVYNRKLKCLFAREGEAHEDEDYINVKFERNICDIVEGPTYLETLAHKKGCANDGNIITSENKIEF